MANRLYINRSQPGSRCHRVNNPAECLYSAARNPRNRARNTGNATVCQKGGMPRCSGIAKDNISRCKNCGSVGLVRCRRLIYPVCQFHVPTPQFVTYTYNGTRYPAGHPIYNNIIRGRGRIYGAKKRQPGDPPMRLRSLRTTFRPHPSAIPERRGVPRDGIQAFPKDPIYAYMYRSMVESDIDTIAATRLRVNGGNIFRPAVYTYGPPVEPMFFQWM
jgi:hypothetical protein